MNTTNRISTGKNIPSHENKVGKNVQFSKGTVLGDNLIIGNNVTFHGKVVVENNCTIMDGCVLGRPPIATQSIIRKPVCKDAILSIGEGTVIGSNTVLYTGTKIGKEVLIGDLSTVRESCDIGNLSVIGRGVLIMYNTKIGNNTKIIDGAIITGDMLIENDVFIGPGVVTINDSSPYLTRYGLAPLITKGPVVRKYALIGAGANINAGVEIGIGSIVAPNAMVTHNIEPWTVVMGVPAKPVRKVTKREKEALLQHFKV